MPCVIHSNRLRDGRMAETVAALSPSGTPRPLRLQPSSPAIDTKSTKFGPVLLSSNKFHPLVAVCRVRGIYPR